MQMIVGSLFKRYKKRISRSPIELDSKARRAFIFSKMHMNLFRQERRREREGVIIERDLFAIIPASEANSIHGVFDGYRLDVVILSAISVKNAKT